MRPKLLNELWKLHADVSVTQRNTALDPAYVFYLIMSGEPEHVENVKSRLIDFDFVNTGAEVMLNPVQIGGLEATVSLQRGVIHVDLFARDERRPGPTGRVTAMRYFMCAALAAVRSDLPKRSDVRYQVMLEAADRGDGKLIEYYRGFGFASSPGFPRNMHAPLDDILTRCGRF